MAKCTFCSSEFRTNRGLGQHIRRTHPIEANNAIDIERVKPRWSAEETRILANEECTAIITKVHFINKHLVNIFPDRSLEAIKGKRRQQDYKVLVAEILAGRRRRRTIINVRLSVGSDISTPVTQNEHLVTAISDAIIEIRHVDGRIARVLEQIAAQTLEGTRQRNALSEWVKLIPHTTAPKGPLHNSSCNYSGNAKR